MQCFQELQEYKKEGQYNVPRNWSANKELGIWVNNQSSQIKHLQEGKRSKMTEDRIIALDSIGFGLELRCNDNWMHCFQELKNTNQKRFAARFPRNNLKINNLDYGWLPKYHRCHI